jgi:hypothetical protein
MPVAPLRGVTLDCPEPVLLAEFYRRLAGGEVVHSSPEFVYLATGPIGLAFQRAADYKAPSWPDTGGPQQAHLDFHVADSAQLDVAEAQVLALGATRPAQQPRPQRWRVLLDPAGHPFCLTSMGAEQPEHRSPGSHHVVDHGPLARFAQRHRAPRSANDSSGG